jgi:hypothetical protein
MRKELESGSQAFKVKAVRAKSPFITNRRGTYTRTPRVRAKMTVPGIFPVWPHFKKDFITTSLICRIKFMQCPRGGRILRALIVFQLLS